jgi:DNA mismatch repair protein MutS2
MQKQLETLEFPKILERLARYARFSASKELALALRPSPYLSEVQSWQTETSEADHLLSIHPNIGVGGARDVRPNVARAQRGAVLTALELIEVRQTLIAARDLQRTIIRLAESYPRLADMAGRIEPCPGVVNDIGQAIDERGEIKDNASPALARIRRDLQTAYGRLMEKLNRIIASPQHNRYLQEALITQRAGRYVIPLKADFKGRIRGVIHDQSASGATLFIEPLATIDLNNRWRQLQLDEADEIRRILAELSDRVGQHGRFIDHTIDALAELDLAFAKAKYAEAIDAVEPILFQPDEPPQGNDDVVPSTLAFKLMAARHPLLDPESVVPIDITLPQATSMLVITGPNTGGKTVSLKTVGLLAAMAQAGLRIPAMDGSALPVFNHIFADIGDEQSIEQSLSTFSGHMTNIVQILEQCDWRSLIILDELGAGTDPIEGSALARSILAHLLEAGVTTFVATHFSELKAYAHTTPGIANASMAFDLDSLAPTYRLQIGLPGASNAFAIARRLGLSEAIINRAQGLVGEDARQIEAMLTEIKAETEAAHRLRKLAEAEREEAVQRTEQLDRRLAEIEAERRDILNSARADAREEIEAVRQEIKTLKAQAEAALEAARVAEEARQRARSRPQTATTPGSEEPVPAGVADIEARLEQLEQGTRAEPAPQPAVRQPEVVPLSGPLRPGDQVYVNQFGTVGEVVEVQKKQVEIQLGHFRTTVPLSGVELRGRAAPREQTDVRTIQAPPVESPGLELDLRGQVAADALINLDHYLDQAFLAQLPWVRIIHGKGSGALRQAVRQALSGHPLVSSYRPGDSGEGGEGVTVAKLALR